MNKYYFFFYFLLLHVTQNWTSTNCITNPDENGNRMCMEESNDNIILQSVKKNTPFNDPKFQLDPYPLCVTYEDWNTLNEIYYQNDLEKISSEKIIDAISIADCLVLNKPVRKGEQSVMEVLLSKAKRILDINDFKNIDEEKIDEIKELKELKNYILYPYQLAHDFYKKQEVFKVLNPNSGWYTDWGYYIRDKAKEPSNNRKVLIEEIVYWSIISIITYVQPWGFSFLIASLHAYILQNNLQKWFSWYSYAQQFQQVNLNHFPSNNKKYDLKYEVNRNAIKTELYIVEKNTNENYLILDKLDKKKYGDCLKVLSMDNKYISCCDFVYDIQNQSTINIEKNYIVVAYLAHDVYLLVKTDQFTRSGAIANFPCTLLGLSNFMCTGYDEKICEIGIGKKFDNEIQLICSLKKYTESTGFPSDILLSIDCTKLFVYFLEQQHYLQTNKNIVQIFSLPDPNNLSFDDLFVTDNTMIEKIKPLKGIFFYLSLLLFLYKSGYFFLRDKIILEKYKKWCEINNWHALILKSMCSFKNNFFPPIKRFLRKEYIRVSKENVYSRSWKEIF